MEPFRPLAVALAFVLASSSAAFAQAGGKPVGPELLQGSRLVLTDANCSVDAPDPVGWEWDELQGQTAPNVTARSFSCRSTKTGEFELFIIETATQPSAERLTLAGATEIAKNISDGMAKSGHVTVSGLDCTRSDVPRPGESYHFKFDFTSKALFGHVWGYVTDVFAPHGHIHFILSRTASEAGEPASFTRMARTFRFLKEPESPSVNRQSLAFNLGRLLGYFLPILLLVALYRLVMRGKSKPPEAPVSL
jgi:hypothetical protein